MMRNNFTQRRNERRGILAVATARNVPAYCREATYSVIRYGSNDLYRSSSLVVCTTRFVACVTTKFFTQH